MNDGTASSNAARYDQFYIKTSSLLSRPSLCAPHWEASGAEFGRGTTSASASGQLNVDEELSLASSQSQQRLASLSRELHLA